MEPQPPTSPLPPFLAAVRRRHPDVDVVVLPSEEPPTSDPTADDEAVSDALRRVDAAAAELGTTAGCEPCPAALRYGPVRGTVRARSHCSSVRDDGVAALRALLSTLEAQGWQVRRPPGAVHRLVARTDGLELRASYAEPTGAYLFDLSSGLLTVGDERARELVAR